MNDYYDPFKWGADEVRSGRLTPPPFPMTVYNVMGDDTSGVAGLWMPSGEFIEKAPSRVGTWDTYVDDDFRTKEAFICWDGAVEEDISPRPIGWEDTEKKKPIYQGKSRGLLLGDYGRTDELYRALALGLPIHQPPPTYREDASYVPRGRDVHGRYLSRERYPDAEAA